MSPIYGQMHRARLMIAFGRESVLASFAILGCVSVLGRELPPLLCRLLLDAAAVGGGMEVVVAARPRGTTSQVSRAVEFST